MKSLHSKKISASYKTKSEQMIQYVSQILTRNNLVFALAKLIFMLCNTREINFKRMIASEKECF